MRTALSLPTLLLGLFVAACGGRGPATLVVTGSGFASLEDKAVKVAVVDAAANRIAVTATPSTVTGGAFQFSLPVTSDTSYRVDLYVDAESDGQCQWGFDKVYAMNVPAIREHATRTVSIDPAVTDSRGCLSFGASSLHVTASNLQTNKEFWSAALVRCPAGNTICVIGAGETAGTLDGTLTGGKIDLVFDGGIVPGYVYRVNMFINDHIGTRIPCDSTAVRMSQLSDLLAGLQTDGLTGRTEEMLIDAERDEAGVEICPSFP